MFRLAPGIKSDPVRRWNLSERVFFACGACHILAYAFLDTYPDRGFRVVWIRPADGFTGNHVFVTDGETAFDFHGYRCETALVSHHFAKGRLWWPGWDGTLVPLPQDVLISEAKSKTYDGLWLREPGQFLRDATPRARAFLARFGPPPETPRYPRRHPGRSEAERRDPSQSSELDDGSLCVESVSCLVRAGSRWIPGGEHRVPARFPPALKTPS